MPDDVQIVLADARLLPACLALLPMLATPEAVIAAALDGDGTLLGAGGMDWRLWSEPQGLPAWIHVLPDSRRRGIGRRLLAALAAEARGEAALLWSIRPLDEAGDGAAFARACGAWPGKRQFYYETKDATLLDNLNATIAGLAARGRLPAQANVRPIEPRDLEQVKWLVVEGLSTPPPLLERNLARGMAEPPETAPVDRERSFVVEADGAVVGALLSRRVAREGASDIICNVVDPRWRRRWANAMLLHRFSRETVSHGCVRIRFDCAEDVIDTIGLAHRSKADHVRTEVRYAYAVAAAAED